jgi:hypothetical protein
MAKPNPIAEPVFSPEAVAQYHRDGYVVARALFSETAATQWKALLKARLTTYGGLNEPSGVRVWMVDDMDPLTRDNVGSARLVAALAQLIGPDIEFLSVKAVFKNAQTTFPSPWHQDWFYWQGAPKISVWIALDEATPENGCLKMIPGSQQTVAEKAEIDDGHGFSYRLTDEMVADRPVEILPVQRGDAVFFHDLTLHASCPNRNGQERWTAIATYRSGTVVDSSTVWQSALVLQGESVNH